MNDRTSFLLLKACLPAIGILLFTVFALYQFQIAQNNEADSLILELQSNIDNTVERRIEHIKTISNSMTGFYLGSELVESHEFVEFTSKILESNIDVVNLFVIEENLIINSYPHVEFENNDLNTLPNHHMAIDDEDILLLEFPLEDSKKLLIALPVDYFITNNMLANEPLKLLLYDIEDQQLLFGYDSELNPPESNDVLIPESENNRALHYTKNTNLKLFDTSETLILQYVIWKEEFTYDFTLVMWFTLLFGIVFSIVLTILIFNSLRLQLQLKKQSSQIRDANLQLEEALKLRNEFAAMISHELKSPLTPIKGFCSLLKNPKVGPINKKQLEYVNEINANAEILEGLIDDLLVVRKLDMGKMTFQIKAIQTETLLQNIYENWNPVVSKKNCKLVIKSTSNLCVRCDERRLRQVFANLIRNALDFIPTDTGVIELAAVSSNQEKFVIFSVKDNGIGIPKSKQKDMFKKFYQVDSTISREHGGTGLGLSICQGLIEGMGGYIWFESNEDIGTTFFFKLPAC